MTLIQSIILGIVQGLTEFIPVSSSGHLAIVPHLLNMRVQSDSFDLVLHAGTLLALIVYFRKDLLELLKNKKLLINIFIGAVPTLLLGFIFRDFIKDNFKSDYVIIFSLIIVGILMIIADFVFKKNSKTIEDLTPKKSIIIGSIQILSLIRGVSRSGITIIGGLLQGLTLKDAARFSFLVSIPVIGSIVFYQGGTFILEGFNDEAPIYLITGFLTSAITGYLAIKFMLKFLENKGLTIFGIYRIVLGIIILLINLF